MQLVPGEVVHRVFPVVELVEAVTGNVGRLPVPGLAMELAGTDELPRPLPPGIRAVEVGTGVVTDRRVVFLGRHRQRDWWFAELVAPAHHCRSPLTLLPTVNGSSVAGLLVSRPVTLTFRFYLTLAFADGLGNRDAVAACLDELVARHQRARPTAPPVARPEQAPVRARLNSRQCVGAVAAVAASVVAAFVVTAGVTLPPAAPTAGLDRSHPSDASGPTSPAPSSRPVPPASPQPDPPTVVPPPAGVVPTAVEALSAPNSVDPPAPAPDRSAPQHRAERQHRSEPQHRSERPHRAGDGRDASCGWHCGPKRSHGRSSSAGPDGRSSRWEPGRTGWNATGDRGDGRPDRAKNLS